MLGFRLGLLTSALTLTPNPKPNLSDVDGHIAPLMEVERVRLTRSHALQLGLVGVRGRGRGRVGLVGMG